MSSTTCAQPGCTGAILDGYCDVCGAPAPPASGSAAGPSTGAEAAKCSQPGCPGTVLDGYCDVCGSPAAQGSPTASASLATMPAGVAQTPSTVSRASNRLASTAPRLRTSERCRQQDHAAHRHVVDTASWRAARCGSDLDPPGGGSGRREGAHEEPDGAGGAPDLSVLRVACRALPGRPARADGGLLPDLSQSVLVHAQAEEGDVVGGQYVVAGAIAHGGLGWIYAARDHNVSDRWVVLKGLLNSGDPDALAAAIAERRFLAQVEHPLIVEIYNFVTHEGAGYIVMEYVGGTSLKQPLKERMRAAGGTYNPLPVDQAIAFIIEILPAFQYLHDLNLVYCDFKPRQPHPGRRCRQADRPGGVRRLDDLDSAIYGTTGYQAPEVPHVGPSVASDIYTIGRTLTVLAMEFRGYQSTYVGSLPPVDETPLFQRHDSLYRLLLKACAADPADRFVSADELRVQLLGVLREVVALEREGAAEHSTSSLFDVPTVSDDSLAWQDLPRLRADDSDPQMPWLRTVSIDDPVQRLAALEGALEQPGGAAAQARSALEAGHHDRVDHAVNALLADDPWSGAPSGCQVSSPSPGRGRPRRRARSTRSTARCPASSRQAGPRVCLRDRR